MASLIKDKRSGYYYAQFCDSSQRPQQKRIALKTTQQRLARAGLRRLIEEYVKGSFDPWQPELVDVREDLSLLGIATEAYLASCSHLKPKTLITYEDVLHPFLRFTGDKMQVRQLCAAHVSRWLDSTTAGDITRRKYVNHLGYLFRFLVRRGEMESDISKDVPLRKVPESAPKSLTPEQVSRLISTIYEYRPRTSDTDFSWLARLIEFNVQVGLRRGELIHLRREHVDLLGGAVGGSVTADSARAGFVSGHSERVDRSDEGLHLCRLRLPARSIR